MSETVRLLTSTESTKKLNPEGRSVLATAYVGVGESPAAKAIFEQIVRDTHGDETPERKYINAYARVYLALMDGPGNIDELVAEAMSINCKRVWKEFLPLVSGVSSYYDKTD